MDLCSIFSNVDSHQSVVVKRELRNSIYRVSFVLAPSYSYEIWVVTERTRLRVHVAKMNFLNTVAALFNGERLKSLEKKKLVLAMAR